MRLPGISYLNARRLFVSLARENVESTNWQTDVLQARNLEDKT
jgi:hypothetical protein